MRYCVIPQEPTQFHPDPIRANRLLDISGPRNVGPSYIDINEAFRFAERQHIQSGKSWFYTVIECEK